MPIPFLFLTIATPVFHFPTGAWIATGASGYIAGTVSTSWVGSFILGNAGLASILGVSGAGIAAALGGLGSATATGIGSGLTTIGLGGLAASLGIAPVPATFLGLTPVGWALAGVGVVAAALATYFSRRVMRRINEERRKGGLDPITVKGIVQEVRLFEKASMLEILKRWASERDDISVAANESDATVSGQSFSVNRLKYVINQDGSEEIVFVTKTGRTKRVLLLKPAHNRTGETLES